MLNSKNKYLKYKNKYINIKNTFQIKGGGLGVETAALVGLKTLHAAAAAGKLGTHAATAASTVSTAASTVAAMATAVGSIHQAAGVAGITTVFVPAINAVASTTGAEFAVKISVTIFLLVVFCFVLFAVFFIALLSGGTLSKEIDTDQARIENTLENILNVIVRFYENPYDDRQFPASYIFNIIKNIIEKVNIENIRDIEKYNTEIYDIYNTINKSENVSKICSNIKDMNIISHNIYFVLCYIIMLQYSIDHHDIILLNNYLNITKLPDILRTISSDDKYKESLIKIFLDICEKFLIKEINNLESITIIIRTMSEFNIDKKLIIDTCKKLKNIYSIRLDISNIDASQFSHIKEIEELIKAEPLSILSI
jgi:hypothetical protein